MPKARTAMNALFGRRRGLDLAEQTVALAVRTRGEVQRVGRSRARIPMAELQRPQPVDLQRRAVGGVQLPELDRLAGAARGGQIEGVNLAVAEIADEKGAAERAESRGRERESPGRVEPAFRGDALEQVAGGVVGVDEAVTDAGDVV